MGETYFIRTFGCQMNKHDSERVAGLFSDAHMTQVTRPEDADVVVFMTCCVRENADERLRGQVASLKSVKTARPQGQIIAVGGCIGQRDGARLLEQLPHVDVVFGTHNLSHLMTLIDAAREGRRSVVEVLDGSEEFTSDLPTKREHAWHAWVPITVGCDNFCSYCIVPHVRGRERSRSLNDIVAECERLVAEGVVEITLLGQNVNSYGRDLHGSPRFAEVLKAVAATGVPRIRFATSHPKDLSEETIRAIAELPAVARSLHLPFQSGSDRILAAMNRHYTKDAYLGLVERLYYAIPDLALSTDIIVGFPGESEADFTDTMNLVVAARFDQAFTFIYSPRAGTPAATFTDMVPRAVAQDRFDRLVALVQGSALEKNRALVGSIQNVLITGASKRDSGILAGRSEGNKVVHVPVPEGARPGDLTGRFVRVAIDEAQTWFLSGYILDVAESLTR
ncbi:MAG: tRNA (N6-isopentenyl adenosine(37)-C2)-methylthiotransferase MiaB [Coriobacteriia bacterium]|jgi:tRNA-2-methylthio-N6-dimethylallyladenosine synthase|nr:tRNA (N6-isopentenyl adenosine(37)-C2)-methylthiotransferase MiaB [Coriobacteriia bacterium]